MKFKVYMLANTPTGFVKSNEWIFNSFGEAQEFVEYVYDKRLNECPNTQGVEYDTMFEIFTHSMLDRVYIIERIEYLEISVPYGKYIPNEIS